jgi:hypothetical protein
MHDSDCQLQPLSGLSWWFDYDKVAEFRLFLKECENASSLVDLENKFEAARMKAGLVHKQSHKYLGKRPYRSLFRR